MNGQIRSRVTAEEYRALPSLNISRLKELKRSGLHYQYRLENPVTSPPLVLGTAAHCAVLEPERFSRQFAVWSRRSENTGNLCPRNGKHWEAFQAENLGKDVITEDECSLALAISSAVRQDPYAARYLEMGDPEVTLEWEINGRACKGRVDWLTQVEGEHYLVGLKTTRDCRPFVFGTQAAKLDYAMQWAWYYGGYIAIRGTKPKLREIVVESTPPHAVAVYRITDDIILQGEEEYQRLLEQLDEYQAAGVWPGPLSGEEDLTLPTWYYRTDDDVAELGLA